jgi:hypothetical protein
MLREIEKNIQQVQELKRALSLAINALPDNPRIHRLGGGERSVFTMSSKDIGGILAAFYHDFKAQYRKLGEIVNAARLETIGGVLVKIVESGSYFENRGTIKFHPDVCEHLRVLLGLPVCGTQIIQR